MRSRWESVYTDDGTCLLDHRTGREVVVRKLYGNDRWAVSVYDVRSDGGRKVKRMVFSDEGFPRRTRPTRAQLASVVDSIT